MQGISKTRKQGYGDPLLVEVMKRHGFDKIPLYEQRPPETLARRHRWAALAKDRDGDVIQTCTRIGERLGCEGLTFQVGDIAGYEADNVGCEGDNVGCEADSPVDLVVSLHACDTATDDTLAKAVGWKAGVILAVPCCQHELAGKLQSSLSLSPLETHGILRERFAALATDALRAQILEFCGYDTQVVEFIDMQHTAKNVLIRAIRRTTGQQSRNEKIESYRKFKELLGLEQIYLEEALGNNFDAHRLG